MPLDVAVGIGQIEANRFLRQAELAVEVVDGAAVGIEDLALEGAHAQMLQGDRMLVAHGLQMPCHHAGRWRPSRFQSQGTDALDFLGQHDIVVRDVGDDEGAQLAGATLTDGARRTDRTVSSAAGSARRRTPRR
jgi:hypothetical protein